MSLSFLRRVAASSTHASTALRTVPGAPPLMPGTPPWARVPTPGDAMLAPGELANSPSHPAAPAPRNETRRKMPESAPAQVSDVHGGNTPAPTQHVISPATPLPLVATGSVASSSSRMTPSLIHPVEDSAQPQAPDAPHSPAGITPTPQAGNLPSITAPPRIAPSQPAPPAFTVVSAASRTTVRGPRLLRPGAQASLPGAIEPSAPVAGRLSEQTLQPTSPTEAATSRQALPSPSRTPAPTPSPLQPAPPPAVSAARKQPRESRIHIGRVEVQVNNTASPHPTPAAAPALAPVSGIDTHFLSRFSLRV